MAKYCVNCRKKIGFLSGYHENEDGSYTCDICFDKQKKEKEIDEAIKKLWNCRLGGGKMVRGIGKTKVKKKPWKTRMERDIIMHKDIKEAGLQGGKVIGDKLSLLAFIIGIPMLIIGLYSLFNMLFGFGFPINMAIIILILLVNVVGLLLIIGGYFIYRGS